MARALALLLVLLAPGVAAAAEVTVLCPRGVQHVIAALAQDFQRRARHTVWMSYGTAEVVARRASTGEGDVVVGSEAQLVQLEARGVVRPGTRVILGRVGIGVAVRAGAPVPDVSSERALRRAILQATSVGYADPAGGGQAAHVTQVLETLTIAALVLPKTTVFADGLRTLEALAKDRVTLALAPISEIVGSDGVALAGPVPEPVQQTLVYAAAVMARSAVPDVASAFLSHLRSAEARERLKAGGVDPE
jgi:molybdate transport system substrate-binding protein